MAIISRLTKGAPLIGRSSLFEPEKRGISYIEKNKRPLTFDPRSVAIQNPPGERLLVLTPITYDIFIGNGSESVPTQIILEGKLTGESITSFQITGNDVSASSTTNYVIDNFAEDTTITSYIDGGKCSAIGNFAFQYCTNLSTINFPQVTTIGNQSFQACVIDVANFPEATSIGYAAFTDCASLISAYFPSLNTIPDNCFSYCTNLETLYFSQATNIVNAAFYNCTSLVNASFPEVTNIANVAFYNCTSLVTASFPQVTNIDSNAFFWCYSLQQVTLPSLSGPNALGGSAGDNLVFYDVPTNGTGSFPSFYSSSNAGSPDGDIAYLQGKNWKINWL